MDKKQLKHERTRGYFIDAACDIIEQEGLSEVSVRKVADRAGYHFTTIYSHFDDFNHVIHHAILKFMSRIMEYIDLSISVIADPLDKYIAGWEAYSRFLIENPNIARCLIMEKGVEVPEELPGELQAMLEDNPLMRGQKAILADCINAGYIPGESAMDVTAMMAFICSGAVVQFIAGAKQMTQTDALRIASRAIRAVIASVKSIDR